MRLVECSVLRVRTAPLVLRLDLPTGHACVVRLRVAAAAGRGDRAATGLSRAAGAPCRGAAREPDEVVGRAEGRARRRPDRCGPRRQRADGVSRGAAGPWRAAHVDRVSSLNLATAVAGALYRG